MGFEFTVEDNGTGFCPGPGAADHAGNFNEKAGPNCHGNDNGNGLTTMSSRLKQLGGSVHRVRARCGDDNPAPFSHSDGVRAIKYFQLIKM
jgi:signal transduction histidine kinase